MRLTGYNRQYIRSGPLAPDCASSREKAVALVITLLFLSVITFLAVAFLAMTHRSRNSVVAGLDVDTAKSMSDAGLARAEAGIVAQMMATTDLLSYDYSESRNFISTNFLDLATNPLDVNYDYFLTNGGSLNPLWPENIGNLYYDPRPPVFVPINSNGVVVNDFRYWVDINRNGMFESNGLNQQLDYTGSPISGLSNYYTGEPEWIGILKYPQYLHSYTNPFVGRYAFLVQPIGKTLDWNFIHNYSKQAGASMASPVLDYFIRDEGVGSWELNLAAMLNDMNTNMYPAATGYNYNPYNTGLANTGVAFNDAVQFVDWRYNANLYPSYPLPLNQAFPSTAPGLFGITNIDEYGLYPGTAFPFDYAGTPANPNLHWPGSYNTNAFYDIEDVFDPAKTGTAANNENGTAFSYRFANIMTNLDSYDRYTFQRMISSIGTGSSPEYGVYVYPVFSMTNGYPPTGLPIPSVLRTKVNINFDNTAQIQAGPYDSYGRYTPMPTTLSNWTALGFFTNAAESLLRSQVFVYTNYTTNALGAILPPTNFLYMTFDVTNIPVYNAFNPGITYNEQVHRMLQVAANIYAAAYPTNFNGVPQPPVFRPQFQIITGGSPASNIFVNITNFTLVTNDAASQINLGFYDLTNAAAATLAPSPANVNFWGVPWVIGTTQRLPGYPGLPAFDQYNYQTSIYTDRKLLFIRQMSGGAPVTNKPPQYTNQFYEFSISNTCGMDAWNPYTNYFTMAGGTGLYVLAHVDMTVTLNNNAAGAANWTTNIFFTNQFYYNSSGNPVASSANPWTGWANGNGTLTSSGQFRTFLQTNFVSLPFGYYSESLHGFYIYPNGTTLGSTNPGFLPADMTQTTYPTHNWSVSTTNHVYYALFDGLPGSGSILDFVNLGAFGRSVPLTQYLDQYASINSTYFQKEWSTNNENDAGTTRPSQGVLQEINDIAAQDNPDLTFYDSLVGIPNPSLGGPYFGPYASSQKTVLGPFASILDSNTFVACDPLVHYTLGDLTYPQYSYFPFIQLNSSQMMAPLTNALGKVSQRYAPWPGQTGSKFVGNMLFMDPAITNATAWRFPTSLFPSVGWLGRVHRGTPWQTIYLKADDPGNTPTPNVVWQAWVNSPFTYPTNDWPIVGLFTAVPNDNAARGLLSVNQTNDAAWGAVFGGVITLPSNTNGVPMNPTTDVAYIMDATNGINALRTNQLNGVFHSIGDILQSPALTTQNPYVQNATGILTDEMVERVPQQTLGLLKLGLPQFVIYSWGQSLRPKQLYSGAPDYLNNICTNYEITGEYKTRTVCHVVGNPGQPAVSPLKIVVDSFNIDRGN